MLVASAATAAHSASLLFNSTRKKRKRVWIWFIFRRFWRFVQKKRLILFILGTRLELERCTRSSRQGARTSKQKKKNEKWKQNKTTNMLRIVSIIRHRAADTTRKMQMRLVISLILFLSFCCVLCRFFFFFLSLSLSFLVGRCGGA